jgi:hypothetical protein
MLPGANAVRGILDELNNRFARDYAAALQELEDGANTKLDDLLGELSEEELDYLLTTIRARRGLLSIGAAYGNEVVATSKQILAFGGAGIGLAAAFLQRLSEVPPFILKTVAVVALFYGNLILLSLYIIFSFSWQARFRYPFLYFKRIGNTVPFFYYQAISSDTPRSMFQSGEVKYKAASLYASDLVKFVRYHVDSVVSEEDVAADSADDSSPVRRSLLRAKRRIVRDEIQQYFLVVSYQGYVNQFEVKMNNHFLFGVIGATLGALLISGVMFFRWMFL